MQVITLEQKLQNTNQLVSDLIRQYESLKAEIESTLQSLEVSDNYRIKANQTINAYQVFINNLNLISDALWKEQVKELERCYYCFA